MTGSAFAGDHDRSRHLSTVARRERDRCRAGGRDRDPAAQRIAAASSGGGGLAWACDQVAQPAQRYCS